jgi:peroxiredoxin
MKKFIIPVFLIFAGCSKEKAVQIKGTLRGTADMEMIYLQELGGNETATVSDSVKFDDKGYFIFKKKLSQPAFYSLKAGGRLVTLLVHPGEKVVVSGDVRHLPLTYSIEGSKDSESICQLSRKMEHTHFVRDSLNRTLQKFLDNRNIANIQRQLEWNYINEVDSLRAYNIRFLDNDPKSLVSIYILYQKLEPDIFLFSEEDDLKYFQRADSFLYKRYPKVPYVKVLHSNVINMTEQSRLLRLNRLLSLLGREAPDISLSAPTGEIKKLSALRGKYVLLDFWASWSAPCRTENINLLTIYEKYRNKGFEVFQVSLDQSKTAWERAIREDDLPWVNVSDLKFWDSETVKQYGIETIPANFLIDKDGTVLSKGLKGEALDNRLSELFTASE